MPRQIHQYHPTLGYHFIPGLRARLENEGPGYLVRVNDLGFRSEHEFTEKKAEGTYRILLFGDSFTAGDAVSNRDRYSDRLETLLPGVEVYNFGLPGTGTDQQYLAWREFGQRFEYDLLVIGVLVENIRRVAARFRTYADDAGQTRLFAKPYFTLTSSDELTLHHVPAPRDPIDESKLSAEEQGYVDRGGNFAWLRTAVSAFGQRFKERAQQLTRYQPLPAYDEPDGADWRLMRAILRKWVTEAAKPTIICPIPLHQYVEEVADESGYQARFRELASWSNVTVHDPLSDFRRAPKAERRGYRFERDVHLTPAGHRVLAESLARAIQGLREHRPAV